MNVPPCVWLDAYQLEKKTRTRLCEPAADIVEPDTNDVATFEGLATWVVRGAVAKEVAVAETQVFEQVGVGALGGGGICERRIVRDVVHGVSAHEALVTLADDVCLASSVAGGEMVCRAGG